jgi:hypothetical protein
MTDGSLWFFLAVPKSSYETGIGSENFDSFSLAYRLDGPSAESISVSTLAAADLTSWS